VALLNRHPKQLILILLLLLLAAWISYIVISSGEPVSQGRKLSAWLQELHELGLEAPLAESEAPALRDWEARQQRAVAAIRSIGPKALPYLLKWLSVIPQPSPWRDRLQDLLQKQSLIKITLPQQHYRGEQAIAGFGALGSIAVPALPKLQELLLNPRYSEVAAAALYAIGPDGFPVLSSAATNTDFRVQYHSIENLVVLAQVVGPVAVPVLVNLVTNSRCQYHREALLGLGDLGTRAHEASFLLEATTLDLSNPLSGLAMRALAEVSENPTEYVPIFSNWLSHANSSKDGAFALARVGREGLSPLVYALTNENRIIKAAALGALLPQFRRRATNSAPPPSFSSLSKSFDSVYARNSSVVFISRPDLEAQAIGVRLAELLTDADPEVRVLITQIIGRLGPFGAFGLSRAVLDPDAAVRNQARAALMRLEVEVRDGAIVRGPQTEKRIALIFAGHEFAEGAPTILDELDRHKARASFFLTGDFLLNQSNQGLIQRICAHGHYLGPHSDKHLLYCSWEDPKRTLVTRDEFWADLQQNLNKLGPLTGSGAARVYFFVPSYEHYNLDIVEWASDFFFLTIAPTPGVLSSADCTNEVDPRFVSSKAIFESVLSRERQDPHGLNGFILLFHLGSGPNRTDKFHERFGDLLDYLTTKGYEFVAVDELLDPKAAQERRNSAEANPQGRRNSVEANPVLQQQIRKRNGLDH
jgi:peptidoglycan/xylan/chitin deacetylase (PgdA/CDA1 family)